ncbi:MAG: DNA-3-methyladenine glycosylase [Congregibacter sp.]
MAEGRRALTPASLNEAVEILAQRDADLAAIVRRCGAPTFWSRPPGFASLVYIIFEQQVSLASAKATFEKVLAQLSELTPTAYLQLSDKSLRSAGVSRQKMRYTRLLAEAILDGHLPIARLGRYTDERVRALLTSITGIGDWTADVYMMAALRRPDLWPVGDLALVKSVQSLKVAGARLAKDELIALGDVYRPYRTVATHIFWRHYLHKG